jgi:glycosyltransferase involved in cell wall biosynthesis
MDVKVLTFYDGGALAAELSAAAVPILSLHKRSRWDVLGFSVRLIRLLRQEKPETLYSFLTVPNVVAAVLRPFVPKVRLIWGLRASKFEFAHYDPLARVADRLEQWFSHVPDLIVSNSFAGRQNAIERGFPAARVVVVPNGIDTQRFAFQPHGRQRFRSIWKITDGDLLVGIVARVDPMKGYPTFLRAMAQVGTALAQARFVCVGFGDHASAAQMHALAQELGIGNRTIWAGMQSDMPAVYSALDIVVSSSAFGEGFSNSIAEAMSCERLCVVTDVGDSARIVGDAGFVVRSGDETALTAAVLRCAGVLATQEGAALGAKARARIEANFALANLPRDTLGAIRQS